MKTNNIMIRPMGQFHVEQRTKDGMFNATALLKQWNEATNSSKELKHFFENAATEEFVNALIKEEKLHGRDSAYVKSKARADRGGGTWMHPLLFIDFAMWINPTFKVKVLKFVYDQMIKYRNEAGDAYKALSAAVSSIVGKSFMNTAMANIAKGINYVVFGDHYSLIRNDRGEESMQRELFDMERKVADLITEGFLRSYDSVIDYLRARRRHKYLPKVLR